MKNLVFLIIFLLSVFSMHSQILDPPQRQFQIDSQDVFLSDSLVINVNGESYELFKQKDFILGWHWAGPRKLTRTFKIIECHN